MKRLLPLRRERGFTLIEMLTVMLIIAILASLILGVNSLVQSKAARARAEGEIKTLSLGCENYKVDNGIYPRSGDTDTLDPREHTNPAGGQDSEKYQSASKDLYKALSGDTEPPKDPDFKPDGKIYLPEFFKPNVLAAKKDAEGKITEVKYIQDPFGQSYGYSTAGAEEEEEFLKDLRKNPNAQRPAKSKGFNSTFDLWSTGGSTSSKGKDVTKEQARWIKNW
jgi:prepilin-type N-terminal cleavage/methylation domain-containing protein